MQVVLDVALPVFAIILAGFLAGRIGVLGPAAAETLNRFVYWFALPAVLFLAIARRQVEEIANGAFVGAFLGATLLVYAVAWAGGRLARDQGTAVHGMQALTASFANTAYMGIPLFLAAFGPERILPAIIATVLVSSVLIALGVGALELGQRRGVGPGRALRDVGTALVRNPLILSSGLGLVWSAAALPLPPPLLNFAGIMGAAAGPCALFAIGLFLAARPLRLDSPEVPWIVALKLLVHPAAAWLLAVTLFPMDAFWTAAVVLLAALPAAPTRSCWRSSTASMWSARRRRSCSPPSVRW